MFNCMLSDVLDAIPVENYFWQLSLCISFTNFDNVFKLLKFPSDHMFVSP